MSKFKKETSKRAKRINKEYMETSGGSDISEYKRTMNPLEELCVFLGDDLQEECILGDYGNALYKFKRNRDDISFYKTDLEYRIKTERPFIKKQTDYFTFLLRSFFYHEVKVYI